MKTNIIAGLLFVCLLCVGTSRAEETTDTISYAALFQQIEQVCNDNANRLWGTNLYAPLLLIDSERQLWSNRKDKQGLFRLENNVYRGDFPTDKNFANTVIEAFGQRWVTVALPLPTDEMERISLICHEMFHYWQDSLRLVPTLYNYNNKQMDKRDARILLKFEWNALYAAAIANDMESRKQHITNALSFRVLRQQLYPDYVKHETAFEIHEGLPQYTGMRMAVADDNAAYLNMMKNHLESYMQKEELLRTYAYLSGELYGFLLDQVSSRWHKQITGDTDLSNLLQQHYRIHLPTDIKSYCAEMEPLYPQEEIYAFENRLDSVKQAQKAALVRLFTNDTKELPLEKMSISFNPNYVTPLEGLGSVYKQARIVDNWGILETVGEGVILISEDWRKVILPNASQAKELPSTTTLETSGWRLELK